MCARGLLFEIISSLGNSKETMILSDIKSKVMKLNILHVIKLYSFYFI